MSLGPFARNKLTTSTQPYSPNISMFACQMKMENCQWIRAHQLISMDKYGELYGVYEYSRSSPGLPSSTWRYYDECTLFICIETLEDPWICSFEFNWNYGYCTMVMRPTLASSFSEFQCLRL